MTRIDQEKTIEMTVAEHRFHDTIEPTALTLFGKSVDLLTFEEASQLVAFFYDLHANPDSGSVSHNGREVADVAKDGQEAVSGVMSAVRKELSRLSLEGTAVIISVKESISAENGTYVKGSAIVKQLQFPRISGSSTQEMVY